MTATIFGGCMRLYPANHATTPGPRWHVDTDHHTIGIDPTVAPFIDPDSGYIHFYMLEKNPIIAATVAMDESLTARGISGGVSNGTHLIRIRFYKDGVGPLDCRIPEHYAYIAGNFCNAWITILQNVPAPPEPVDLDDLVTPAMLGTLRYRDIIALRALGDAQTA